MDDDDGDDGDGEDGDDGDDGDDDDDDGDDDDDDDECTLWMQLCLNPVSKPQLLWERGRKKIMINMKMIRIIEHKSSYVLCS